MSFFTKKTSAKKRKSPFPASSKQSKKSSNDSDLNGHNDDDDEILSDASDVEGRPDAGYESDPDDVKETAEEKGLRLAKMHLEEIEREERDRLEAVSSTVPSSSSDLRSAVSSRLRREELEESGKFRREMAEQCRDAVYGDSVKRFRDSQAHKLSPTAVTVSPSGAFAYTASIDGNMVKWRLLDDGAQRVKRVLAAGGHGDKQEQPKKKKANKKKHAARINALAISSDGKFLASGDDSNLVNIWNADTMDHIRTFRGHRDAVSGLAFRRKTHTLYSCSFDRSVKIWNLDEMAYVETLFGHQDRITGIDAGVRERAVTSGGRDGSVRVWKIVEESQLVFNGPANSTDSVKLINEEHFATCGEDGHISLWGNMKKKPLFTLQSAHGNDPVNGEPNWVSALATLPMSDLIASGSRDGHIRLWKTSSSHRNLEEVNRIPVTGFVNALSFSPDGRHLVAAVGQEHRLGRWWRIKEAKNSIVVIPLMLKED